MPIPIQVPDNYDQFLRHESDLELRLKKRPICSECGEHIQDDYAYRKDGLWTCQRCMNEYLEVVMLL